MLERVSGRASSPDPETRCNLNAVIGSTLTNRYLDQPPNRVTQSLHPADKRPDHQADRVSAMIPPTPWSILLQARHFSLHVVRMGDAGVQLEHMGSGRIRVEQHENPDRSTIIWRERGCWTSGPVAGVPFGNSTAWCRNAGAAGLDLSHLRRGNRVPTFLVRLQPAAPGLMVSERPHLCGPDSYSASLSWSEGHLELRWDILSPTDPYQLRLAAWGADRGARDAEGAR